MRFDIPNHADVQPAAHTPKTHKKRLLLKLPKITPMAIIVASCAIIIVALAGLSAYLITQNSHLKQQAKSNTGNQNNPALAQDIVKKVDKLYALPKNETPTIATIKDISQLKGQDFFNNAQNGDYVLVYPKAKIALLYRDSQNRIINIGPVSIDQNGTASPQQSNPAVQTQPSTKQ